MFDTVLLYLSLRGEGDHSVRSIQIAVYHNITLTITSQATSYHHIDYIFVWTFLDQAM